MDIKTKYSIGQRIVVAGVEYKVDLITIDNNHIVYDLVSASRSFCGRISSVPEAYLDDLYKKPILDRKEKRFIRNIILPFKDKVVSIGKYANCNGKKEYINIQYLEDYTPFTTLLPYFKAGTMYKGMKLHKEYTLEELGL